MALKTYNVLKTDAATSVVLSPTTVNGPGTTGWNAGDPTPPPPVARDLDINLVGEGNVNWGKYILENMVHMLENFTSVELAGAPDPASSIFAATTPTKGQLWFNETRNKTFVYNGTGWNTIDDVPMSSTAPSTPADGHLWYDTTSFPITAPEAGRRLRIWDSISGTYEYIVDDYLPRNGNKSMLSDFNMGSNKITNLSNPTTSQDAMTLNYADDAYVNVSGDTMGGTLNMNFYQIINAADPAGGTADVMTLGYSDNRYVNITGDAMTGDLSMSSLYTVTNLANPTNLQDAMTLSYADGRYINAAGDIMTGVLSMNLNKITNLANPTVGTDAANKDYVDTTIAAGGVLVQRTLGNVLQVGAPSGLGISRYSPGVNNANGQEVTVVTFIPQAGGLYKIVETIYVANGTNNNGGWVRVYVDGVLDITYAFASGQAGTKTHLMSIPVVDNGTIRITVQSGNSGNVNQSYGINEAYLYASEVALPIIIDIENWPNPA